jgi:hypothetical protein
MTHNRRWSLLSRSPREKTDPLRVTTGSRVFDVVCDDATGPVSLVYEHATWISNPSEWFIPVAADGIAWLGIADDYQAWTTPRGLESQAQVHPKGILFHQVQAPMTMVGFPGTGEAIVDGAMGHVMVIHAIPTANAPVVLPPLTDDAKAPAIMVIRRMPTRSIPIRSSIGIRSIAAPFRTAVDAGDGFAAFEVPQSEGWMVIQQPAGVVVLVHVIPDPSAGEEPLILPDIQPLDHP